MKRRYLLIGSILLTASLALADEPKKEPTPEELKSKVARLEEENRALKEAVNTKDHQLEMLEHKLEETLQEKLVAQRTNPSLPNRVPPSWTPKDEKTSQWHYLIPLENK